MHLSRLIFLLAIGVAAATAAPITYDFTFTGSGLLPTSGSFTYDPALGSNNFTAFTIIWDSLTFNLASSADSPELLTGECGTSSTPTAFFLALTDPAALCGAGATSLWIATPDPDSTQFEFLIESADTSSLIFGYDVLPGSVVSPPPTGPPSGDFTISQVPEPNSIVLALAGGATLMAGKRKSLRTRKATQTQNEKG